MSASTGQEPYDLVIIGSGPGGYIAAVRAGQLGLRTAIVEREELGGVCLNWGCIPSKALLRSAEVLALFERSKDFGISIKGQIEADYGAAIDRCNSIIDRQTKGVAFLMKKNKVEVVRGTGRVAGVGQVAVATTEGDRELAARNILIATGSRVRLVPGMSPDTVDGQTVVTSKEVWKLRDQPKSVIIIGGGPIGVEFATVYRSYGVEVTIVEMLPRLLPLEDEEVSTHLTREFKKRKINILTSTKVLKVTKGSVESQATVEVEIEGQAQNLKADRVLLGIGFAPNSENLGLEETGVKIERGFVQVDDQMQTSVPGIYAIGDVTGKLPLAHVASAMGVVAVEAIAGQPPHPLDYNAMPRCTYSQPQVASLGLTEAQCKERGIAVKVGKFAFNPNGKAQAMGEASGFVKIISDARYGEVLGAHMVGPEVVEMIGEFSLLKRLEGTSAELAEAVHPHPTLSEALAEAGLAVDGLPLNA